MKPWRIWLLLLLALLLPVRGAVAAAMMCPVPGSGPEAQRMVQGHPGGHEGVDDVMPSHHHDAHDHSNSDHPDEHSGHEHAASEGCSTCSAYCSLTPYVGTLPPVLPPLDLAAVRFADLPAPPPSFVSDGQERPPRTI